MNEHTQILESLASELFGAARFGQVQLVAQTDPLDLGELVGLDRKIGGPSIATISGPGPGPGTLNIPRYGVGRYEVADREVFRPLQYCGAYFIHYDMEWMTRDVVEMSCAHIESLIKRIGSVSRLPLGAALNEGRVKKRIGPALYEQVRRFVPIYNDSKHRFDQDKDAHLFSIEDAVLAYFVSRELGNRLYPMARLNTNLKLFDVDPHWLGDAI